MTHRSATDRASGAAPVTPDGRYLVVRARLWRRSNPRLRATERERHVRALMRARRVLRDSASLTLRRLARAAVDRAKRALGERGPVWWRDGAPDYERHLVKNSPYANWYDMRETSITTRSITAAIRRELRARAPEASTCPSEIARRLAPQDEARWRALMPRVREAVGRLIARGQVRATRGTRELDGSQLGGGPIRIRRGPKF